MHGETVASAAWLNRIAAAAMVWFVGGSGRPIWFPGIEKYIAHNSTALPYSVFTPITLRRFIKRGR